MATLVEAAKAIPTDPSCLRRALNRFGIVDTQDDGQRVIDDQIVALFARTKRVSGYLYPRTITTLGELLAAASELPEVAVTDISGKEANAAGRAALADLNLVIDRAAGTAHSQGVCSESPIEFFRPVQG